MEHSLAKAIVSTNCCSTLPNHVYCNTLLNQYFACVQLITHSAHKRGPRRTTQDYSTCALLQDFHEGNFLTSAFFRSTRALVTAVGRTDDMPNGVDAEIRHLAQNVMRRQRSPQLEYFIFAPMGRTSCQDSLLSKLQGRYIRSGKQPRKDLQCRVEIQPSVARREQRRAKNVC